MPIENSPRQGTRRVGVVAALSLALVAASGLARADDGEPPRAGVVLRVDSIAAGQSVVVGAVDKGHGVRAVSECSEACALTVDPGLYRLRLRAEDGRTLAVTYARVEDPIAFHVVAGNRTVHDVGVGLGIGGLGLVAAGLSLVFLAGLRGYGPPCSPEDPCDTTDAMIVTGVVAAVLGLVMAPTGLVMALTGRPRFGREKLVVPGAVASATLVHAGITPVIGGAAAGLSLSF